MSRDVKVERYELSVEARDSLTEAMGQFDTDRGGSWEDLMSALDMSEWGTFVMAPDVELPLDDKGRLPEYWCSDNFDDLGAEALSGYIQSAMFQELQKLGYIGKDEDRVWTERSQDSYQDEDAFITVFEVLKPFKVIVVRCFPRWPSFEQRRLFVDVTATLEQGWYVVAEYGDVRTRIHSVGFVDDPHDLPTFEGLAGSEGLGACHASAGCNKCGGRWYADSGSWSFKFEHFDERTPELVIGLVSGALEPVDFGYDDADHDDEDDDGNARPNYRDDTILCPIKGCGGRVGFMIYG